MQIRTVTIHNFRSITDATFHLYDYTMLVGANNSGKTNAIDAIRVFYEHDKAKFNAKDDAPKCEKSDEECWIDIEYRLTDDEADNLKDEYLLPDNSLKVRN